MIFEQRQDHTQRRTAWMQFSGEYGALLTKMLLLTKRKRGQTIAEFLLAYIFLALLLALRSLLASNYKAPLQLPSFHPYETMLANSTKANMTFYYPSNTSHPSHPLIDWSCLDNTCTQSIMSNTMNKLTNNVIDFPNNRK